MIRKRKDATAASAVELVMMRKERPSRTGGSLAWLFANGVILVVILIGLSKLDRPYGGLLPSRDSGGDKVAALDELPSGWWETRRAIYHDIPARVRYRAPTEERAEAQFLAEGVWSEFERIGSIFNSFDPTSEVGRLNSLSQAGIRSVSVSADLLEVLRLSRHLWEASGGRFDPTVWSLKELWREAARTDRLPSQAQLAAALAATGFQQLSLPKTVEQGVGLPRGALRFDFGGIAKGYAVGCVEEFLRRHGVEDALVQLGGEVSAFGDNNGQVWRVGVQHPRDMTALWGVIATRGSVRVSTSGNYRQLMQIGGKTYYHIFDPRDGRPVSTRILGVTTADFGGKAGNALLDGAATAITVMGAKEGLAFARNLGIDAMILVADDGDAVREVMTDRLRAYFERPAGRE